MSAFLTVEGAAIALRGRTVVAGASLCVRAGELVALLGANGAGKSTLLRAAVGLTALNAGRALLGAEDAVSLPPSARARRVAYLPQNPEHAWPVTVEALVALGRFAYGAAPDRLSGADRAAIDKALALVRIEVLRNRPMDTLSGGERARAHLARALAQGAPLLALDEPTAELDPAHALAVAEALRAHAEEGGAVLWTTHDVGFAARLAGCVYVLREGRIIAAGPPHETLSQDVLRSAYGRDGWIVTTDGVPTVAFR